MRDRDIRSVLDERLRARFGRDRGTVIRHELGLCAGQHRVDVALINGHLEGWEIKSDVDSLTRLPAQIDAYSSVLDRSWLVVTERHLASVSGLLPPWWGLVRAHPVSGRVRLTQLRRPRRSPVLDSMATAQLLWRDEALTVLRDRGLGHGLSRKARWYVWERMATEMSQQQLRDAVRHQLRVRQVWPGGQPPS